MNKLILPILFFAFLNSAFAQNNYNEAITNSKQIAGSSFVDGKANENPNYDPNYSVDPNNMDSLIQSELETNENAQLVKDSYLQQDFVTTGNEDFLQTARDLIENPQNQTQITAEYKDCSAGDLISNSCIVYNQEVSRSCPVFVNETENNQTTAQCIREKRPYQEICNETLNLSCNQYDYTFPPTTHNSLPEFSYSNFSLKYRTPNRMGQNCGGYNYYWRFNLHSVDQVEEFRFLWGQADDRTMVYINGNLVHNYPSSGCELGRTYHSAPNINLKPYLRAGSNELNVRIIVGGRGEGNGEFSFKYKECIDIKENWENSCTEYEANELCEQRERRCLDSEDKFVGGVRVIKDCFNYQNQYSCIPADFNFDACQIFRDNTSCAQLSTNCLDVQNDECFKFENRFQCNAILDLEGVEGVTVESSSPSDQDLRDDSACENYKLDPSCNIDSEKCQNYGLDGKCIEYDRNYSCKPSSNNACNKLQGSCQFNSQNCVEYGQVENENQCLVSEKFYNCPKSSDQQNLTICASQSYCEGEGCDEEENFGDAAAHLLLLKEAGADFDENSYRVFSGATNGCSKEAFGFSDCCKSSGWGSDAGLAQCSTEEQNLAIQNSERKCVYVGQYCSKEIDLGLTEVCVEETLNFCCFRSRLSRLIHQQGRSHVGLGWGSAEAPNCRGFTPEELQNIDFTQIDLSEVINDATATMSLPESGDLLNKAQQSIDNFFNNGGDDR